MADITKNITLTDDTLKNIFIMAPFLDEIGQNRVFGLMCGLLQSTDSPTDNKDQPRKTS